VVLALTAASVVAPIALGATAGAAVADDPTTTSLPVPTTTLPVPTTTVPPPPPVVPPAPAPGFHVDGPSLRVGSRGADVVYLQAQLLNRGFWLNESLGVFGQSTKHAVIAYQKTNGLPRTGVVEGWTRISIAVSSERAHPNINNGGHGIEIDLRRQVLMISDAGVTQWVLDISSGKPSTPTPRGWFRIQREINAMRISDLGQLWRPKYFAGGYALHGSSSVPAYAASHGCVRLTNQEIDFLWASGLARVGTPVVLY
jgi:peptidoglycan hydrolase-like protein with peptidoglycan-binding domain